MIKVAFLPHISDSWLGGVNYFKNLLTALAEYPDDDISPVVFLSDDASDDVISLFPENIRVIRTSILRLSSPLCFIRRVCLKIFRRDHVLAAYLKYAHGISIISHGILSQKCFGLRVLSWIPDFQHKHMPQFFSQQELKSRDSWFGMLAQCDAVILSSEDAKNDFINYYPQYRDITEVLHFVPTLKLDGTADKDAVFDKYGITGKYFFIPNQYWIHKNHIAVLKALALLKDDMPDILAVSTGATHDYRSPEYFDEVCRFIDENDLGKMYKILGKIPYDDLQVLARHCHAYVNPSLFEGWSTSVEEAKCFGKPILLSDLRVHREQAPARGVYFDTDSIPDLADKMRLMWNENYEDVSDDELLQHNKEQRRIFANTYYDIVKKNA